MCNCAAECIIQAMTEKKNCCAKFLFIVPPSNSISSGKFSALGPLGTGDWTRIITGNRNGEKMGTLWLQIVLPSKLIGWRRHRCCSFIGPSRHQSVNSQVPSSLKLFFLRGGGGIELQPNSCNRSPQQRSTEENTLNNSHICAWYAATHTKKREQQKEGTLVFREFVFLLPNKWTNRNMVWSDFFFVQDEDLRDFAQINLSSCRPTCCLLWREEKRWVHVAGTRWILTARQLLMKPLIRKSSIIISGLRLNQSLGNTAEQFLCCCQCRDKGQIYQLWSDIFGTRIVFLCQVSRLFFDRVLFFDEGSGSNGSITSGILVWTWL